MNETDPTSDDLERIGREHAKRMGNKKPHLWEGTYAWHDDRRDMSVVDGDCYIPWVLFRALDWTFDFVEGWTSLKSESEAYIALGRAVVACELACGLADRVRAAVEAEREACALAAEESLIGWQPVTPVGLVGRIQDAIRGRKCQ